MFINNVVGRSDAGRSLDADADPVVLAAAPLAEPADAHRGHVLPELVPELIDDVKVFKLTLLSKVLKV